MNKNYLDVTVCEEWHNFQNFAKWFYENYYEISGEKMRLDKDILIKGNKMSETFQNHWAIPDVAYFMIVTGESTGELAEMLDKVADFYTKQQKSTVGMIKTFVEPVMILFLAVVVGFILVAILVPMFGIYSTVA